VRPDRTARRPPLLSRIAVRLLAFNVLVVFLPVAAFLYLDTYERQLLRALEHALVQQARVLAAGLSGRGELDPRTAAAPLIELRRQQEARIRVLDFDGRVLADSSRLGPTAAPEEPTVRPGGYEAAEPEPLLRPMYRLASLPIRLYRRLFAPPEPPLEPGNVFGSEVREALAGRYGAATRISAGGQRSVTLYSAVPVWNGGRVVGAVLVSQSTYRILRDLYELRLQVFAIFLASLGAAVLLSLVASTTIAVPLERLRRQAGQILDRRGRLRSHFRVPRRRDEIGALARALRELTGRLEAHLAAAESFAADLSHELKNPLASIRAAAELVPQAGTPVEQARFLEMIQKEVARLESLLARVREIAWLDARLDEEEAEEVDLRELVEHVVESLRLRTPGGPAIRITPATSPPGSVAWRVRAAPARLAQVLENLFDNAVGFTPAGSEVEAQVTCAGAEVVLRVEDRGPGIPPEHLHRVFDRFFSYRPEHLEMEGVRYEHPGLGLAIVKAIVERYGGSVRAENREGGGARFEVRLPAKGHSSATAPAAR
jgi:two-component system sensor histidine kinase ChvG